MGSNQAMRLSPKERLDLISRLWDSFEEDELELTPEQKAELDRRLTAQEEGRDDPMSWEEFRRELQQRLP